MLVIRRRVGESILIGPGVEIQVIEISPTRVKIGIAAAVDIPVMRKESKLVREQNMAAAQAPELKTVAAFLDRFHQ